ncbi:MAG: DUF349 domain-containing protein [Bacteroidia bacterium]|nr:DUF349 domain-containing protein [Bacteroidia bacterium]
MREPVPENIRKPVSLGPNQTFELNTMFPENENPELSDLEQNEEQEVQENPTPQELTPSESEPLVSPEPVAEESPLPEMEAETDAQEENPVSEVPEHLEVAHIEAETEEESAQVVQQELPPFNEELLPIIDELVEDKSNNLSILEGATVADLIHLLDRYKAADHVLPLIPKVGLVKRTFDALVASEESFPDTVKTLFHNALHSFNRRRSEAQQEAEAEKIANSKKKQELLVELEKLISADDPNLIKEVRAIQDAWRDVGHVLKEDIEPLYQQFRVLLDKFYQLREMHFELRDYDRKINLQEKERLIKEAEELIPKEEDRDNVELWRERMDMLHELQQKWKAVGHVPREEMERINNEYRDVVDKFFETRQGFMEIQDQFRLENAEKKLAILEKMAAYSTFTADKPRSWNDATRTLRELQEEWKKIGQAPGNQNSELWAKYREACNAFFTKKAEFFRTYDDFRSENLVKKRELVEQAEALQKGEDWEKAARELKRLQKEWREIGPVPERHSNKLWARFREACDGFFENRRGHYHEVHEDENTNLEAKKALIEEVKQLTANPQGAVDKAIGRVKELQAKWKEIGKVPFKEKDKIWDEFRAEIDKFFGSLDTKREHIQDVKMQAAIESVDDPDERTRTIKQRVTNLRRKITASEEKVNHYSTNILFVAKGKSGDALRSQIQSEIDREVKLIDDWKRKIKKLNEILKNPPAPNEEVELGDEEENS